MPLFQISVVLFVFTFKFHMFHQVTTVCIGTIQWLSMAFHVGKRTQQLDQSTKSQSV